MFFSFGKQSIRNFALAAGALTLFLSVSIPDDAKAQGKSKDNKSSSSQSSGKGKNKAGLPHRSGPTRMLGLASVSSGVMPPFLYRAE
ncbi:hypothetical protein N9M21_05640 [Alphaproteobacteria bacterium]|nr:hypothetical protein [Alphaproteobacteria bacterium]